MLRGGAAVMTQRDDAARRRRATLPRGDTRRRATTQ